MLDFPSLLYKGLRILMFQLSGVYCRVLIGLAGFGSGSGLFRVWVWLRFLSAFWTAGFAPVGP